jgi:glycosyltransferase involved in cell wall biosynthesis
MLADGTTGEAQTLSNDGFRSDDALSSVLLVTPRWARDGGVGAHVVASAKALASRGVHVHVLTQRIEADADADGVTLFQSDHLFNADAPMERRLGEALSCEPDVIHLHQVDEPEIARALHDVGPLVISAHAYTACTSGVYYFRPGEECVRGHGPGCIPNLALRGCAHTNYPKTLPMKYRSATRGLAALRVAELAVSYSSAVDRHLAANGIAPRIVVPYFPTMAPRPAAADDGRRRVVFAGRIVRPKGVDVLIRAACEVNADFVVCGDGRQLGDMRSLAAELGVAQRVDFRGWLDAEELADELANASIVVVPSLWPEPFGLVGIEAQAAGRPAVASSTGGIVDWLEDGVSGLCVPPGDPAGLAHALNELLEDPERRRAMGEAGKRSVAARFSSDTHLHALLEGYRAARSAWQLAHTGRSLR